MNYRQLLIGVLVIVALVAGAYFFVSPKAEEAIYGTNDVQEDVTTKSFEAVAEMDTELNEAEDTTEQEAEVENEVEEEAPAAAVEEPVVKETPTVQEKVVDEAPIVEVQSGYTLAEVATHKTEGDCWTAINKTVYDVTAFFGKHPGGDKNLFRVCGIDGTAAFTRQHGGAKKPNNVLAGFEIGALVQ